MKEGQTKLSPGQRRAWQLLMVAPMLLVLAKQPGLPWAETVTHYLSLLDLPPALQRSVGHTLLLPLGALIVVFFRVTLGIRVLGPFRSVLLAMAFQVTGIFVGVFFLAAVVSGIVLLRPLLEALGLSYYSRVSTMLTAVAAIVTTTLLASSWLHLDYLYGVVHFPMVVLCLMAEAIGKTLEKEGVYSALWRGAMTAVAAVLITLLAARPGLQRLLLHYPELLLVQIGTIILVGRFLAFRLAERFNPEIGTEAIALRPVVNIGRPLQGNTATVSLESGQSEASL